MRLLLDTHALLWFAAGDMRIQPRIRPLIESLGEMVFVSAASAGEIATKVRLGKLPQAEGFAADFPDRSGANRRSDARQQ